MEQQQTLIDEQYRYFAFISYKREDEQWAKWLQHKLEHYKLPLNLNGRTDLPREIRPVFKDTSELTPGNLPEQIHKALDLSKYLIVICSPRSAQSEWVNKEIVIFIGKGRTTNIIPFIIDGAAFSKDPATECYPIALRSLSEEQEILGANINEMGRDAAAVKIVARMFDMQFDMLWQRHEREQRRRRNMIFATVATFVLGVLCVAAWIWHQNSLLKEKDWNMMINQSRYISEKAHELVDKGDSYLARILAIDILPIDLSYPNRPYTAEAEAVLRYAEQYDNAIIRNHSYYVWHAIPSPDGKYIASVSWDGTVCLFRSDSGEKILVLDDHTSGIRSVSFSPNGELVAAGAENGIIRIWNLKSNVCVKVLDSGDVLDFIHSICFSPNGQYILSASNGGIRIWDIDSGKIKKELSYNGYVGGKSAVYSHTGKLIAFSMQNSILLWDVKLGKCIKEIIGHSKNVNAICFTPDDSSIISGSADCTIKIWNIFTGECTQTLVGHTSDVQHVSIDAKGGKIVSASNDKSIREWDINTGKCINILEGHTDIAMSAYYTPDCKHIISSSWDNTVRIWDIDNKTYHKSNIKIDSLYCGFITKSPTMDNIASISPYYVDDYSIRIWDLKSGKCLQTLKGHKEQVLSISYSPDGNNIVTTSKDKTVKIWNAKSGKCETTFKMSDVFFACFTQDGRNILSVSRNSILEKWDIISGKCYRTKIDLPKEFVSAINLCNNICVTSSDDRKSIRIWDIKSGESLSDLIENKDIIDKIIISHSGKTIMTISASHGVTKIWDVKSGVCLKTIIDEQSNIYIQSAIYDDNEKGVIAILSEGTVMRLPFLSLQQLIDDTRKRFKNRLLTPEERRKYYLE